MLVVQFTFLIALALLLVNQLEVLLAQYECRAKILLAHDAVLCQFLRLALEEDASLEKQIGAIGDGQRLLHVVVGDKDADVAVFQSPYTC